MVFRQPEGVHSELFRLIDQDEGIVECLLLRPSFTDWEFKEDPKFHGGLPGSGAVRLPEPAPIDFHHIAIRHSEWNDGVMIVQDRG